MKNVVRITRIVFWLSFILFIIILLLKSQEGTEKRSEKILQAVEIALQKELKSDKQVIILVKDRVEPTFALGALGVLMAICFTIIKYTSEPKPELKHGRLYMLIAIIPLSEKRGYSIVLGYDDKIETYQCSDISQNANPKIGSICKVEIENEIVYFSY